MVNQSERQAILERRCRLATYSTMALAAQGACGDIIHEVNTGDVSCWQLVETGPSYCLSGTYGSSTTDRSGTCGEYGGNWHVRTFRAWGTIEAEGVRLQKRPVGWVNNGLNASADVLPLSCTSTWNQDCWANWSWHGCVERTAYVAFERLGPAPRLKGWMKIRYDVADNYVFIDEWAYNDDGDAIVVGDTGMVPSEVYPTIQSAIDAADDGGVVRVSHGIYPEAINLHGKAITVEGDIGNPGAVVLSGENVFYSVVSFNSGEGRGSIVRGLTIADGTRGSWLPGSPVGSPRYGGGVFIHGASPIIEHCRFVGNASDRGGAIFIGPGTPLIRDCVFVGNSAREGGGGIFIAGPDSVQIEDCLLQENQAVEYGGAMVVEGGVVFLDRTRFDLNSVDPSRLGGGGLLVRSEYAATVVISDGTLQSNEASTGGGILLAGAGAVAYVGSSTICGNIGGQIGGFWTDLGGNCVAAVCGGSGDPCDATCVIDLDGDGQVGGSDLGLWLIAVGDACDPGDPCEADFNQDGEVSGADLGILLAGWGACR